MKRQQLHNLFFITAAAIATPALAGPGNGINGKFRDIGGNVAHELGRYRAAGATHVRLFLGIKNWNLGNADLEYDIDQLNAKLPAMSDLHVTLAVVPRGVEPSDAQVRAVFRELASQPFQRHVDIWELGNEPDLAKYWPSADVARFVTKFVKPAAETLGGARQILSAGPASDNGEGKTQKMIDAGLLNYVDYVGIHLYAPDAAGLRSRISYLKRIVNGRKPIISTEWSMGMKGLKLSCTDSQNAAQAQREIEASKMIASELHMAHYFTGRYEVVDSVCYGILTKAGGDRPHLYNAYKQFARGGGTVSSDGGGGTTSPTPGSLTAVALINQNGAKVVGFNDLDAYSTTKPKQVVDKSQTGVTSYQIRAETSGTVGSVRFFENGAPLAIASGTTTIRKTAGDNTERTIEVRVFDTAGAQIAYRKFVLRFVP